MAISSGYIGSSFVGNLKVARDTAAPLGSQWVVLAPQGKVLWRGGSMSQAHSAAVSANNRAG